MQDFERWGTNVPGAPTKKSQYPHWSFAMQGQSREPRLHFCSEVAMPSLVFRNAGLIWGFVGFLALEVAMPSLVFRNAGAALASSSTATTYSRLPGDDALSVLGMADRRVFALSSHP